MFICCEIFLLLFSIKGNRVISSCLGLLNNFIFLLVLICDIFSFLWLSDNSSLRLGRIKLN